MAEIVRSDSNSWNVRRVILGIKERTPSVGKLETGLDQWITNQNLARAKENELVRLERCELDFEKNDQRMHYKYNLPNLERFVLRFATVHSPKFNEQDENVQL